MNEILTTVIYPCIGFVFVLLVGSLTYFVKRFINGQDKMNETLVKISERIGALSTELVELRTRVNIRDVMDDDRHTQNLESFKDIRVELKELRNG